MDVPSANPAPQKLESAGFTFTELLAVLGVVGIVGTIALNALHFAARSKAEALQCMNNHKQLIAAALLYADEFNGLWFPNETGGGNQIDWVPRYEDWNLSNTDNTNINELSDPRYSLFAPYLQGNPKIFHCPSDHSYVNQEGYRVRSVSANSAVGTVFVAVGCMPANGTVNGQWLTGNDIGSGCQTQWRCYGKSSDFVAPGPAVTWVFADENCDSMNDSQLVFQCAQHGIGSEFVDKPANYHNAAAPFSFVDGHCEMHRWLGPTVGLAAEPFNKPQSSGRFGNYQVTGAADNSDLIWIQQRTSARP
ncbi:MAG TPA: type II secretion system protein [Verrucomicrobiae bacterium]|nr:type II secretion system protein [Verrucomicrobiae bacterium]